MDGARAGGAGGEGAVEVQQVGEMQGKISKRSHPRPLSVRGNLRRREEARNGNRKSKAGGRSDGNGWERAGEGLCRAAAVGKGHRAAWSSGKFCRGTLLDF